MPMICKLPASPALCTDWVPEIKHGRIGLISQNWWSDQSPSYAGLTLENPDQSILILGPIANQSDQLEV